MTIPLRSPYKQTPDDGGPPDYAKGFWYVVIPGVSMTTSALITNGVVRVYPWLVRRRVRIQALGCRVNTGNAGGLVSMAVYRANMRTLDPIGAPIVQTGDIDASVAGPVAATFSPVTVGRGLHWIAMQVNQSGTLAFQGFVIGSTFGGAEVGAPTQNVLTSSVASSAIVKSAVAAYGSFPDASALAWVINGTSNTFQPQFQVAS